MKRILSLFAAFLVVFSCAMTEDIENLQRQIDDIKNTQIASINTQISSIASSITTLQETQTKLSSYITEMKLASYELQSKQDSDFRDLTAEISSLKSSISTLEQKSASLQSQIDELQKYIDGELKNAKDWAAATFATLEQYSSVQTDISSIKISLATLTTDLSALDESLNAKIESAKASLQTSISESESSMKSWVNEKLRGYYTIAEMEAKLQAMKAAYEAGDKDMKSKIDGLEKSLSDAKSEITAAYTKAINDAISSNNGVIDAKIASAISEATEALNDRLDALESRIDAIEEMMGVANCSIVPVPDYSDGSLKIQKGASTLRFEILPQSIAEKLSKADLSSFSFDAVYTELTKGSSSNFVKFPITKVTYDGELFTVLVDGSVLCNEFFDGTISAAARLKVSFDGQELTSNYFQLRSDGKDEMEAVIINLTVAEFIETAVDTSKLYRLKGNVVGPINRTSGNFEIKDGTGQVYVYKTSNWIEYKDLVAHGGNIIIVGQRGDYNGKVEVLKGHIESYGDELLDQPSWYENAKAKSVAEFLSAADTDTYNKLTGIISNFAAKTCRFDLTDATGTVYVSRVRNASDWSAKMHNGGTITLAGKYLFYEAGPQNEAVDAFILSYDASTETYIGSLQHPLESTVTWTLGNNSYDNTFEGNNKQTATVNGETVDNLLKLSTSAKSGSATLHIPAGTTKIGFYACSWAAVADLTVGSKIVSVKMNAGCTGNAPYILEISDANDYYEVEVTEDEVMVSCPSRVVMFGITAY